MAGVVEKAERVNVLTDRFIMVHARHFKHDPRCAADGLAARFCNCGMREIARKVVVYEVSRNADWTPE